ncbi:hypothetical protein [Streptomyces prunicolor]|uniref:hypothetical protein n=1 Tax=Streptomyces prunicolor TaxID=67348 RepID=UPI0033F957BF
MATAQPLRLKVIVCKEEPDELLPRLRAKILDTIKDNNLRFTWSLVPAEWADPLAHAAVAEVLAVRPSTPAEAELAELHEGEEPVADPAVVPTPGQLLYQWLRATPQQRLDWAARSLSHAERASRCFEANHEGQVAELRMARERNAAVDDAQQAWFRAAEQRMADGHSTEPRHLADLSWQLATALRHQIIDPVARCDEHDGLCFPQPYSRCSAHGDMRCPLCHRNPASCADATGSCSAWAATGMHWDSCQHRVRGSLAPDPVDEPGLATEELVRPVEEQEVSGPPLLGDRFRLQLDGSWATDVGGGTLTVPADVPPDRREQLRIYLDAYSRALDEGSLSPEQIRVGHGLPGTP